MRSERSAFGLITWIASRYLRGARRGRVPSMITLISVLGISAGVATLIVVLAVLGGFEADLRDKILATKAHLRITGPYEESLADPSDIIALLDSNPEIVGFSPFIESELLLASLSNYSGAVVRGIDIDRHTTTSNLADEIIEGRLEWLLEPDSALPPPRERAGGVSSELTSGDGDGELEEVLEEIEELRRQFDTILEDSRSRRDELAAEVAQMAEYLPDVEGDTAELPSINELVELPQDSEQGGDAFVMPALPPPGGSNLADDGSFAMPAIPAPAGSPQSSGDSIMPSLPAPPANTPTAGDFREVPGIVIGSQLQAILRADIGDVIQLISPDGDMSPAGPIPRSRPYRVVAVFHTGLYEFDQAYAFTQVDELQEFLSLGEAEITAIEVKLRRMDHAAEVARSLRSSWSSGYEIQIKDWREMNSTLFAALMLEKIVMFLILSVIMLVASFAIICMLTVIIIDKSREIAVLRAMGATSTVIRRIFLVEGAMVGGLGTALGSAVGLGVVAYLSFIGFPLDPELFYIDRLPVSIAPIEVIAVILASLGISLLATLYPSMQAAGLDPVAGLRTE